MLTLVGTLAVVVAVTVGAFVVPQVLTPPPTAPVAVATSTSSAVEPASTIRVTEATPSVTTTTPVTPTSSAARDAVTEQVRLADQLLAQYPTPAADQALIDELTTARNDAQALLDDPTTSEAKLIAANSTLSGHNQAFRVHALTKASATTADGGGVVAAPVAEQPNQVPAPDAPQNDPVEAPAPDAPSARRASQSISVSCQAPAAFSITFTASGGGTVELSAAGQSATGAGSASVTAFGQPGQSFSATGSADGSVSVSYSTGGAACS
ncbi:hypothetical protein C5E06_09625 [Pseudoclavibacter sp. RFBI5]|uniref:hypothetical protein n=1 Tax=Pseudoclavibacter sp. RFBI5 TaxID=2080578 RepID=UPI000CE75AA6|nr:hypothetical protein [Pseudoclavibacter sp. RFBI5]PPG02703.1 hypothetical protein C5E06_09625 [Pseudoclavibacter sp. RFBI5]